MSKYEIASKFKTNYIGAGKRRHCLTGNLVCQEEHEYWIIH